MKRVVHVLYLHFSFHFPLETTSVRLPFLYNDTVFLRVTRDLFTAKFSENLALSTSYPLNIFSWPLRHLPLLVLPPHSRPLYSSLLISFTCKCQSSLQQKLWTSLFLLTLWVSLPGPWLEIATFMLAVPADIFFLFLEFQTPFANSYSTALHESLSDISNLVCLKLATYTQKMIALLHHPHLNKWHLHLARCLG